MINIDGIEYRTAAQWEKKHRHVLKGQLKKGVERSWRSPNGNETMMFYSVEQTRPRPFAASLTSFGPSAQAPNGGTSPLRTTPKRG